jgi:hypothetical protein
VIAAEPALPRSHEAFRGCKTLGRHVPGRGPQLAGGK